MIKFRSPVRSCSITTEVRDRTVSYHGDGDKRTFDASLAAAAIAKVAAKAAAAKAATSPVRVVADVKPAEVTPKEKIEIKDLLNQNISVSPSSSQQKMAVVNLISTPTPKDAPVPSHELQAYFIRDVVPDGTAFVPGQSFMQGWILKNPGPYDWPAGCSVRYVGGDNMLNVDDSRPSAEGDVSKAVETNVLRHPVKVGEEFNFHVQMKAPKREGSAISYWRLKAPDGTPFGHRLWCHINVTSQATTVSSSKNCPHVFSKGSICSMGANEKPHENQNLDAAHRDMAMRRMRSHRKRELEHLRSQLYRSRPWHTEAGNEDQKVTLANATLPRTNQEDAKRQKLPFFDDIDARLKQLKLAVEEATEEANKEVKAQEPASEAKIDPESSKMVFPVLIKEEAVSSTEAVPTNAAETLSVPAVAEAQLVVKNEVMNEEPETKSDNEIFEDAESISFDEDESGFHTDDEYDILNASDEEEIKA
jgi:next-to-BRCA1 protein 1